VRIEAVGIRVSESRLLIDKPARRTLAKANCFKLDWEILRAANSHQPSATAKNGTTQYPAPGNSPWNGNMFLTMGGEKQPSFLMVRRFFFSFPGLMTRYETVAGRADACSTSWQFASRRSFIKY
jgi:hypothetical protein